MAGISLIMINQIDELFIKSENQVFMNKKEKLIFWSKWTLFSLAFITLSYVISLIAVLWVHGIFGFTMDEWGTPLSQMLMQIAGGAVIGLGTGIYQKILLQKLFDVKWSWIFFIVKGFVITELITGIILWINGLNRGELRFIEGNSLPESLIFICVGFLTGLFQYPILKKHFHRSGYWIIASAIGWGICILIPYFVGLFIAPASVFGFIPGALLYGAITGATLMWLMRLKDSQE